MGIKIHAKDTVKVIKGRERERGAIGKVLSVLPSKKKALVEHVNMVKRATKPNPQKNIKGGFVEKEALVSLANLALICPSCEKPTRVGFKKLEEGKKTRTCKKCHASID